MADSELRKRIVASSDSAGSEPASEVPATPKAGMASKDSKAGARVADEAPATPKAGMTKEERKDEERPTYGRTPDGTVFKVPKTHDMLSALFDPRLPKSQLDLITLFTLGFQVFMFAFVLKLSTSRYFFLAYFAFWRIAYNGFLGWVLKRQSERRWIVKTVKRMGWMDPEECPGIAAWLHAQLRAKMGKDFDVAAVPLEYTVWLLFRQVVDIILINDFLAYFLFCSASISFPPNHSTVLHILRWVSGWSLIAFNIWVKVDAHRIIHDFAWFWGDAFFISLAELQFDGVFEMAPHPMYSIGYAGFYGASLITGSHVVLLASLAAHLCQFGFLVYFENPHIERTYGQKKPLTARDPLPRRQGFADGFADSPAGASTPRASSPYSAPDQTPSQTDGDTDTESNDPQSDLEDFASFHPAMLRDMHLTGAPKTKKRVRTESASSAASSTISFTDSTLGPSPAIEGARRRPPRPTTRQDLDNRYFRKDLILFHNFDICRSRDFAMALIVFYTLCAMALPADMSGGSHFILVTLNAIAWRCFHSFGLGMVLRWQSERKWLVRHFLKRYHYDIDYTSTPEAKGGVEDAFANWKATYNLSLIMTYVSFGALAFKFYSVPADWTVGSEVLRHTLGFCLIGLHVWTAQSSYDVLGDFGWFYGDFFIEEYPIQLAYTGIYRFLNNPERSMGGAAFFGLVLISASKVVLGVALFSVLCHWWFLSHVENPHMRKLYGDAIRKEAGLTKTLKNAAKRNAHLVQRAPPQLTRRIKEVRGTFEQIYEETAEALDDFLDKSTPRLSDVVRDTRVLLQQSSEKLVLTRVANDLHKYDASQYRIAVEPSPFAQAADKAAPLRFHLGEPISLTWNAPSNHGRADWIGLYRCGANKSRLVTRVASHGKWVGVHDEEWDGDIHIGTRTGSSKQQTRSEPSTPATGKATFAGRRLPWKEGLYEFRYHHDGKHNVMTSSEPVQIFIERPPDMSDEAVYSTLSRLVTFSLSIDPKLAPHNAPSLDLVTRVHPEESSAVDTSDRSEALDPDDFTLMDRDQAKHVAYALSEAFDVEINPEVVVADANVTKLTERVRATREVLRPFSPRVTSPSQSITT